jgi:RNA polymerase primary sigma factor
LTTKTQRLSHVEEIELIRLARKGGTVGDYATNRLVTHNVGLVHKLVNKFPIKNTTCSYDDLYQEGIMGLMHGIRKFDETRGYRLSTYVYRWIQAYIRRYYLNHSRSVRVPVHVSDAQMTLNKQIERLTSELGRTPTMAEIIAVNENAPRIIDDLKSNVSLNAVIGESSELEDVVGEDKTEEFETVTDCHILLNKLRNDVSARDFNILMLRFGLNGQPEHTLEEIAEKYEVSRARIHQIEKGLIQKLRSLV